MKTPPLLILAALAFWGWQSGLLIVGVTMGVVLESARVIKMRWDLSTDDFRRIWNFCVLLAGVLALYIFTTNGEGGGFGSLWHGSTAGQNAAASGIHTTSTLARWLPMIFFLFVAAQNFSEREAIPLSAISMFFRWRMRQSADGKLEWHVNISYPYFIVCLFSAGIHANEGTKIYFWGQCVLLAWALWPLRTRRFNPMIWGGSLLLTILIAYAGTRGIGQLEMLAQNSSAQWMMRFMRSHADPTQATTSLGQIGEMKLSGAIVIRLQTKNGASPPSYLREASYHSYHAQIWRANGSQKAPNEFEYISATTNDGTTYNLLPGKTNRAEVSIACYLNSWSSELHVPEGLLPLPSGSARLENIPSSVIALKQNRTGAVLATGPGFLIFDAHYGPGATIDSPPDTNWDWEVPTNELPAIEKAVAELHISGSSTEQKELAVGQFFMSKFTYSLWQGPDKNAPAGETPLARFLLRTRSGHCEYFATATVLMLRKLGVSARYAVGYYAHESNGNNQYVVRERDAHAWCLVWNGKEWQDFDTTPGSWVATETNRASPMQRFNDFFSWLHFQFSKFRWGQTHLRKYILWAVIPMMGFLLYQIIFRRGRKRQSQKPAGKNTGANPWPGLDSEFYRLESKLAERGVPRQSGETLSDWLERALTENALASLRTPLLELLRLHYRHRFDPNGLTSDERKWLKQKADEILKTLPVK